MSLLRKMAVVSTGFIVLAGTEAAFALCPAGTCGQATRYDVNVLEVALCTDTACANAHVVGSGTQTFNIASAAVGQQLGEYAGVDTLPAGTYVAIRTILDRTFTISTAAVIGTCAAQTNASLSVPNGSGSSDGLDGQGPALTWNDSGKTQVRWIGTLTTPITVAKGGNKPSVKVSFNTSEGFACISGGSYPAPPDVSVTVN